MVSAGKSPKQGQPKSKSKINTEASIVGRAAQDVNVRIKKKLDNSDRNDDNRAETTTQYIKVREKNKDKSVPVNFRILSSYREAIEELAEESEIGISELWRRAAFIVLNKPELLWTVNDDEESYKAKLGPSRHHK